jgi:hypothetical protein
MIFITTIRFFFIILYKITIFSQIIKKSIKKNTYIKEFLLFIIFYIFLNLYLFPTFALCDINLDLLDRENNTYNGSKIVYETENDIVTEEELEYAKSICYKTAKICGVSFMIVFPIFLYLLFTDN